MLPAVAPGHPRERYIWCTGYVGVGRVTKDVMGVKVLYNLNSFGPERSSPPFISYCKKKLKKNIFTIQVMMLMAVLLGIQLWGEILYSSYIARIIYVGKYLF